MRIDHHCFASPNGQHCFAHIGERRLDDAEFIKIALKLRIPDHRLAINGQSINHSSDDEPAAISHFESAGPVAKFAVTCAQINQLFSCKIQRFDRLETLACLLPIRADILNRRSADAARYA